MDASRFGLRHDREEESGKREKSVKKDGVEEHGPRTLTDTEGEVAVETRQRESRGERRRSV
jgi:hypothetical protein